MPLRFETGRSGQGKEKSKFFARNRIREWELGGKRTRGVNRLDSSVVYCSVARRGNGRDEELVALLVTLFLL